MRDIDEMMALVNIKEIKELKNDRDDKEEKIELFQEVMKNVELFLTYWYEQSTEFGKIKDNFNSLDDASCELRVKDGRIKIKIIDNEENNSSN